VIVPHGETLGDVLGEPAEVSPHALPDWFQRFEACRLRARVDADAFSTDTKSR
jgi:hypothetical protein